MGDTRWRRILRVSGAPAMRGWQPTRRKPFGVTTTGAISTDTPIGSWPYTAAELSPQAPIFATWLASSKGRGWTYSACGSATSQPHRFIRPFDLRPLRPELRAAHADGTGVAPSPRDYQPFRGDGFPAGHRGNRHSPASAGRDHSGRHRPRCPGGTAPVVQNQSQHMAWVAWRSTTSNRPPLPSTMTTAIGS
jgi:hypothetical protein